MVAAIATHFDGDASLYDEFAASSATQFALDAMTGQTACKSGDLARLRSLAHNLKSVLVLLGHTDLSDLAARVEGGAAAGDLPSACELWAALHRALLRLGAATLSTPNA